MHFAAETCPSYDKARCRFGVLLWELAVTSHTGERPQRGQLRDVRYAAASKSRRSRFRATARHPRWPPKCLSRSPASPHTTSYNMFPAFEAPARTSKRQHQDAHIYASLPCRVPEELPEEVELLRQDCMEVDPKLRPTAKEAYDRLAATQQQ